MGETNKNKKGCFVSSKEEEEAHTAFRILIIVIMGTLILEFFRLFS